MQSPTFIFFFQNEVKDFLRSGSKDAFVDSVWTSTNFSQQIDYAWMALSSVIPAKYFETTQNRDMPNENF